MMPLPMVSKAFRGPAAYASCTYNILPFRFLRYEPERFLLTNLVGEYVIVSMEELLDFTHHRLTPETRAYSDLKARHFLYDETSDVALELLSTKYRTKQSLLKNFTALHIFVVSLRCDHSCPYCQVSRVSEDRAAFDMTRETADRAIDLMFQSPSPVLKVEFQGGESLLNFGLIRYIVQECERRSDGRSIEFVIATNLSPLNDEMLEFCREHSVFLSTSLDGPEELHNQNRPRPGRDSYQRTVSGIQRARDVLGRDAVSALMTTTAKSLTMPGEIIDEYLRQGFRSIFLRPISPYGFALKSAARLGYGSGAFLEFYEKGLRYILDLNKQGIGFREEFASIVLRKALTPFPTGYVDLQSPSGLGIAVIVYNYDGEVYASDEGRMLAETGDYSFRLGNVHRNAYEELFMNSPLLPMLHSTMTEGTPGCCDCAFLPWCGTDPIFHHATQRDLMGIRPTSEFCRKNMGIFRLLVNLMETDPAAKRILRGWAQ
jgi:uncharacterized protein